MKQYDALYILSQAVAISAAVGVKPVGDLIDATFHTGFGSTLVGALAIVALVGGKIVDRLKNPSLPTATQPVIVTDPPPAKIKTGDLTTPSAVEAQKESTP